MLYLQNIYFHSSCRNIQKAYHGNGRSWYENKAWWKIYFLSLFFKNMPYFRKLDEHNASSLLWEPFPESWSSSSSTNLERLMINAELLNDTKGRFYRENFKLPLWGYSKHLKVGWSTCQNISMTSIMLLQRLCVMVMELPMPSCTNVEWFEKNWRFFAKVHGI